MLSASSTDFDSEKSMKKWLDEISGLVWTLAGTALVLITLSGDTRRLGWVLSVSALVIHLVLIAAKKGDD